eukprot:1675564-Rhodomonas_salina.1
MTPEHSLPSPSSAFSASVCPLRPAAAGFVLLPTQELRLFGRLKLILILCACCDCWGRCCACSGG